ncbi:hypothetical protein Tco_1213750 [Tanacetum coccineum]
MHYDCYYSRINQGEVRVALQKMGRNKAVGPDQFPIEAWRCLGDEVVKWLTCLFNKIFSSAKMPDEWRLSEVIPIYKNKGDAQTCSNYRDDIVLIVESAEGLNNRLVRWREALEDNGLWVSREKTKYLRCDFGRYEVVHQEGDIRIGDRILHLKESFIYLGSVIHRSGRIDEDVAHRIIVGSRLDQLCCMAQSDGRSRKLAQTRRPQTALVRRVKAMVVEGLRRRGRPKLRWEDRLKQDMKELLLSEDMTSDRNAWRDRIRING